MVFEFMICKMINCDYVCMGWVVDSKGAGKDGGGPVGIPSLPVVQKKAAIPVKSATSGSSRELSDDDELEGDTETTQNMDPTDAKRVRR